jgi:translocation and assembly module TamB
MIAHTPEPEAPPVNGRQPRWARTARAWAFALLGMTLLGGGFVLAAWHGPAVWPWLLGRVPGVELEGARGTPGEGRIEIARLTWSAADGSRLQVDGLSVAGLALQPMSTPPGLALASVRMARLHWHGAAATAAPAAPANMHLPVTLRIESLRVGELAVDGAPAIRDLHARLSLGTDAGRRHELELLGVQVERATLSGRATIDADTPMNTQARLEARTGGQTPWTAEARADGPLARLALQAHARGPAAAGAVPAELQGRVELQPFAAWPWGAVQIQGHDVDLSVWSTRLPRTALHGNVALDTQGRNRPAQAQVRIENRLPGPWSQDRLPLREARATLSGRPSQPDDLHIEQLAVQLDGGGQAAAGSIAGTGRWHADRLELALQLRDVQPARLDERAAPMLLGGSVELIALTRREAPGAELRANLDGRTLDGIGAPVLITLDLAGDATAWKLRRAIARSGAARLEVAGRGQRRDDAWDIEANAALSDFDPHPWWRADRAAVAGQTRLSARVHARGRWLGWPGSGEPVQRLQRAWRGEFRAEVDDSRLLGVACQGQVHLNTASGATDAQARLRAGATNELKMSGRFDPPSSPPGGMLDVELAWPDLGSLQPWLAWVQRQSGSRFDGPLAGSLNGQIRFEGRWPTPRSSGQLQLRQLRTGPLALAQADASWQTGDTAESPLEISVSARALDLLPWRLDRAQARVSGSLARHRLEVQVEGPGRPAAWTEGVLGPLGNGTRFEASAQGSWHALGSTAPSTAAAPGRDTPNTGATSVWQWQRLQARGGARDAPPGTAPWLQATELAGQLWLDAQGRPQAVRAEPGRVQLLATGLSWNTAQWARPAASAAGPATVQLQGELETFDVARLLRRMQPAMGWVGDLTVGGRFDVRAGERFDADVVLERLGGDLAVTDELGERLPLGLTELRLALGAHDGLWQFAQGLAGERIGQVAGAQLVRTTADARWPQGPAALQGVIEARVDQLGVWGTWLPPGWRLNGRLHTSATLAGRLDAPQLRGRMRGTGLGLRHALHGVNLADGELDIELQGDSARIEQLRLRAGDGWLTVQGGAELGEQPQLQLQLAAERFRLLGRVDRRIVTTGKVAVRLRERALQVGGELQIEEGWIDVSSGDAPTLDADVRVAAQGPGAASAARQAPSTIEGRPPEDTATAVRMNLDLALDLGRSLRLQGRGLDTGLRGQLRLTSSGGQAALRGAVRTSGGTYAAYGQKLDIERGHLHFDGPLNDPRLDVLAIRPNLDVRAGVSIAGTALSPRVRLFSEPELPEMEKLSWLVLGRGPDGLGRTDTALLQRAAVALLAGDGAAPTDALFGALGLTEFSVRQSDGDVRETVVTLGKQLSRRWYVGYERSVNATVGTWQLIYRVARRFTLRAQTGQENSLDAIWSWRW